MALDIEKLKSVRKIITHDLCPDGYMSALILRDVLDVPVEFCQYNTTKHLTLRAEPGLLFCDFTPPYQIDRTQEFVEAGAMVLDHHKSAKTCIEAFGANGIFSDEPGVCGAVLAYRHVWLQLSTKTDLTRHPWIDIPNRSPSSSSDIWPYWLTLQSVVEDFAILTGIRDTWQKNHNRWSEACLYATAIMFPNAQDLLKHRLDDHFFNDYFPKLLWAAKIQRDRHHEKCVKAIKGGYSFKSRFNHSVIMFQGVRLTSDIAEMVENDIIVGFEMFCEEGIPKIIFSLRSRGNFSVRDLAEAFSGGGHTYAAGFSIEESKEAPYILFEKLLNSYLVQAPQGLGNTEGYSQCRTLRIL